MQRELVSTATAANRVHIGCSGWVYKHWRGIFYPEGLPQRLWFERYAQEFDTVEINNSFYRLPSGETFDKWRRQAPAGFCYAVKANRFLTQAKKLKDCEEPLERMMSAVRRLGDRLGPVLYQLPPSMKINLERLRDFLDLVPKDVANVFEFRHKSWYDDEVLALLDRHGAGFVSHDLKGLISPRWASGQTAYVRFHGTGGKYRGRYSDEAMADWACWLLDQRKAGRSTWAYFNNDIGGDAIEDARALKVKVAAAGRARQRHSE